MSTLIAPGRTRMGAGLAEKAIHFSLFLPFGMDPNARRASRWVLGVFSAACVAGLIPEAVAVELLPGPAITVEQVDFAFAAIPPQDQMNSDWGRLVVSVADLVKLTKLPAGYLNMCTAAGCVVVNLRINNASDDPLLTTYFDLAVPVGADVTELSAYIEYTSEPIAGFACGPLRTFPVGTIVYNAEGVGDPTTTSIGPPPPVTDCGAGAFAVAAQPGTWEIWLPHAVNVQAACNQCVSMSVANSLQYLEQNFGLAVPHAHTLGLRGDNTLVGQLDTFMNRFAGNPPNRNQGNGLGAVDMFTGKFNYLSTNGLAGALIHRYQGYFYGAPSGGFTAFGITAQDESVGGNVTFDWIRMQLERGADVELWFSHPTGGHAVRVYACGETLGRPWVRFLHDGFQPCNNPILFADGIGLEWTSRFVEDLDQDGILNLGASSLEIRFTVSESPGLANCPPAIDWGVIPAGGPAWRWGHAMAYDSARRRRVIVMFGGLNGNQTWEWDGTAWTQRFPATRPSGRTKPEMIYDRARGVCVLFGGADATSYFGDTWEWDGTNWTNVNIGGPVARVGHAMAYDALRRVTVLFGGFNAAAMSLGDTWEYNGAQWTQRSPSSAPSARAYHAMAYDARRAVTVLYGGTAGTTTWEWNGSNWAQRSPNGNPGFRSAHKMVFDSARGVTVLCGGNMGQTDTWNWNGAQWTRFLTGMPDVASEAGLAYDDARRQSVLFGGVQSTQSNDTWVFPLEGITRAFQVIGNSTGVGWSWCINGLPPGPGFSFCDLTVQGVASGGSAANLVNRFVQSINTTACSTGDRVRAVANGNVFTVTVGGNQGFDLCLGPSGQQPNCCLPPSSSCSFNPGLEEVMLSGFDCNGNLVDDAIDFANGTSEDENGNGVPDECEGVAPIPTVSEWGLVVLTLLLLVAAKVYFRFRDAAVA